VYRWAGCRDHVACLCYTINNNNSISICQAQVKFLSVSNGSVYYYYFLLRMSDSLHITCLVVDKLRLFFYSFMISPSSCPGLRHCSENNCSANVLQCLTLNRLLILSALTSFQTTVHDNDNTFLCVIFSLLFSAVFFLFSFCGG